MWSKSGSDGSRGEEGRLLVCKGGRRRGVGA